MAARVSSLLPGAQSVAWRRAFDEAQQRAAAALMPSVLNEIDGWTSNGRLAVPLSRAECRVAAEIGLARNARNREAGVRDGIRSKTMSSGDIDVQGAIAEYAALKALKLDVAPLLNTDPRCVATDVDADMVLPDGRKIDVKSSFVRFDTIPGNRFDLEVHPSKEDSTTDIFLKVIIHTPRLLTQGNTVHTTIAARTADESLQEDQTCCIAVLVGYATHETVFSPLTPMGGINNAYRLVQAWRAAKTTALLPQKACVLHV